MAVWNGGVFRHDDKDDDELKVQQKETRSLRLSVEFADSVHDWLFILLRADFDHCSTIQVRRCGVHAGIRRQYLEWDEDL